MFVNAISELHHEIAVDLCGAPNLGEIGWVSGSVPEKRRHPGAVDGFCNGRLVPVPAPLPVPGKILRWCNPQCIWEIAIAYIPVVGGPVGHRGIPAKAE